MNLHTQSRKRPRVASKLLGSAIALILGVASAMLMPAAANAAASTPGAGYDAGGYHLGSYVAPDGSNSFLLYPGILAPDDVSATATTRTTTQAISAHTALPGIGFDANVTLPSNSASSVSFNKTLRHFIHSGMTPVEAAGMQAFIWATLGYGPGTSSQSNPELADFYQKLSAAINAQHGAGTWAAILNQGSAIQTWMIMSGSSNPDQSGTTWSAPTIVADPNSPGNSRGFVTYQDRTAHLDLSEGYFTGRQGISDGSNHFPDESQGFPGGTLQTDFFQSGSGSFDRYFTPVLYNSRADFVEPNHVRVFASTDPEQSPLITVADLAANRVNQPRIVAGFTVDSYWEPTAYGYTDDRFVQKGEAFTVTPQMSTSAGQWKRYRGGAEVLSVHIDANYSLYGPYLEDPTVSGVAPTPDKLIETIPFRTDPRNPALVQELTSTVTSSASGFYAWVATIEFDDQSAALRTPTSGQTSIPADYSYSSGFLSDSVMLTPSDVRFTTELTESEVTWNQSFRDQLDVFLSTSNWLQMNGQNAEYEIIGQLYHSATQPVQSDTVPADATLLNETSITVDRPYSEYMSDPQLVPFGLTGWVTMRWCMAEIDDPENQQLYEPYCDDYGVPAETAQIVHPTATTNALAEAEIGDQIYDVAQAVGPFGDYDSYINFTAYLVPEAGQPKFDSNWAPILSDGQPVLWTADEVAAAPDMVQPVYTSANVTLDGPGEYRSPSTEALSAGTIHWVHRIYAVNPEDSSPVLIDEGEYGIAAETTAVAGDNPDEPGGDNDDNDSAGDPDGNAHGNPPGGSSGHDNTSDRLAHTGGASPLALLGAAALALAASVALIAAGTPRSRRQRTQ